MIVKIKSMRADLPRYETSGSAGMDLAANLSDDVVINPGEIKLVPTGIFLELPEGYEGQVRARSGLAIRNGITPVNGIGTIDSDYRGEIKVGLINLGKEGFRISDGDRIAQLIISKYETIQWERTDALQCTARAEGGFGHTGINKK